MSRCLKTLARTCLSGAAPALFLTLLCALWLAPSLAAAAAQNATVPPEVVARVEGEDLGREALLEEASASLDRVRAARAQCEISADKQEHEAWEHGVERLVRRRLFSLEASRRGVSEEALKSEIEEQAGEVAEEDIDTFYEQNKARIRKPKEAVADQIRAGLERQLLQSAENDFITGLKESYSVSYLLEPLRADVDHEGFPQRGDDTSPVTLVEFSDFECPYCQRALPLIEAIEEKYGERVNVVFRQYPLSIHPNAPKAAEASLCARDQGKFWEMHDLMFAEQQSLGVDALKEKASRLELDGAAFAECLDTGRYESAVAADVAAGTAAGVDGTPAFFINGRHISGAVPFETLETVIDDEIRRAGGR